MVTKECKKCKKSKLLCLDNFPPNKNLLSGFDIYCRCCRREMQRKHYYENRDKEIQRSKNWNKKNPEKVALNMAKCRQKDPGHYKQYQIEYRARNKSKVAIWDNKKRSIRRLAISQTKNTPKTKEVEKIKAKAKGVCYYCGIKSKLTLDHITPLAKGGAHTLDNFVFVCKSCNSSKGAKCPYEYAKKIGMLLI